MRSAKAGWWDSTPSSPTRETAGVENIIVEIEGSSYDDIVRSVRECIDYLLEAPFVEASYGK